MLFDGTHDPLGGIIFQLKMLGFVLTATYVKLAQHTRSAIPTSLAPVIPEMLLIGNPAVDQPTFWIPDKNIRG